ncbi:MAG: SAM-dependent methyltransferase [Vicingaceae bacterium]|jgi:SAM-dependent methyltransferase
MDQLTHCPACNSNAFASFITTSAQMHTSKESFNFDQCNNCQLVFLNPRVPLDKLKNYYTAHYLPYRGSEAWGKYEYFVKDSQQRLDLKRVERVKEWHKTTADSLVLDVGCGKPTFLKACKTELKCTTIGIDFSDEGWRNSTENYKELDIQVAEIKDLPLDLHPDVITMWHYLEHDYTPQENLRSLKSISKPSTTLIIEIPNLDSSSRKEFGADWAGWHTPRHTSLFSPSNVELLLNNSGWKVSKILTYGTMDPYLLYWMSRMGQKGIAWDKNMEDEFWAFTRGMICFLPKKWNQKNTSLGIMTVIATPIPE